MRRHVDVGDGYYCVENLDLGDDAFSYVVGEWRLFFGVFQRLMNQSQDTSAAASGAVSADNRIVRKLRSREADRQFGLLNARDFHFVLS